jgi:hypothetical protein
MGSPPVTLNFFQGLFLRPRYPFLQWMLKQVQHNGDEGA